MSPKLHLDKPNQSALLFNTEKRTWEDRTMSISAMYKTNYHGKFTGYNVYFKGAAKYYFYQDKNVQFLNKTGDINIEDKDVYANGKIVSAFKLEQFEYGYYRVHYRAYGDNGAIFTKNIKLKSTKHKDIFNYYSELAEYAGTIAENLSPLYFLSVNYKRITLSSDSVLFDYLKGECKPINDDGLMIFPFDFNQSRIRDIVMAL
jgi:hypothetical protein